MSQDHSGYVRLDVIYIIQIARHGSVTQMMISSGDSHHLINKKCGRRTGEVNNAGFFSPKQNLYLEKSLLDYSH